jgi:hypothetical protein
VVLPILLTPTIQDQAGAAKKWAAAKSVSLGKVSDLVGVVNFIGGITNRH